MNLTESIKQKATDIDFDLVGVTSTEAIDADQIEYLSSWLTAGHATAFRFSAVFSKNILPTARIVLRMPPHNQRE